MHRLVLMLLLAATAASAADAPGPWRTTVTDRLGNPLWEVSYYRCTLAEGKWASRNDPTIAVLGCDLAVTAKNISGIPLPGPYLVVKVTVASPGYSPDPATVTSRDPDRLKAPGEAVDCYGLMLQNEHFSPDHVTTTAIEIKRSGSWQSPQEEAANRKAQAEADAETDANNQRIRVTCSAVYRATIDKAQRDLTVREIQAMAYCREVGWYQP